MAKKTRPVMTKIKAKERREKLHLAMNKIRLERLEARLEKLILAYRGPNLELNFTNQPQLQQNGQEPKSQNEPC